MSDLATRARHVITESLGTSPDETVDTADLYDDLGADSLDHVEVVMRLENEFGIHIPDQDAHELKTVKDVVDYIEKVVT